MHSWDKELNYNNSMTVQQSIEEEKAMDVFFKVFERFADELGDKELTAIAPLLQSPVWQRELAKMIQGEFEYRNAWHDLEK
jgi:hypothetical protein